MAEALTADKVAPQQESELNPACRSRSRKDVDGGVSTVFGCLAVGLLLVVTAMGIRLGGALLARQQAENAADLGSLAGATEVLQGSSAACALAAEVVGANRGVMTSCVTDGLDLLIEVQVPAWGGAALARARAGPVTTP